MEHRNRRKKQVDTKTPKSRSDDPDDEKENSDDLQPAPQIGAMKAKLKRKLQFESAESDQKLAEASDLASQKSKVPEPYAVVCHGYIRYGSNVQGIFPAFKGTGVA